MIINIINEEDKKFKKTFERGGAVSRYFPVSAIFSNTDALKVLESYRKGLGKELIELAVFTHMKVLVTPLFVGDVLSDKQVFLENDALFMIADEPVRTKILYGDANDSYTVSDVFNPRVYPNDIDEFKKNESKNRSLAITDCYTKISAVIQPIIPDELQIIVDWVEWYKKRCDEVEEEQYVSVYDTLEFHSKSGRKYSVSWGSSNIPDGGPMIPYNDICVENRYGSLNIIHLAKGLEEFSKEVLDDLLDGIRNNTLKEVFVDSGRM